MYKAKKFPVLFTKTVLSVCLCSLFLFACGKDPSSAGTEALDSDTSYSLGMLAASQMASMGFADIVLDYESFAEGYKALAEAEETRISMEQAMEKLRVVYSRLQTQNDEEMRILGERNREEGDAYLAANKDRNGIVVTSSGLQYEVITQGSGRKPGPNDSVQVQYEGTFIDGSVFDSSYERGVPAEFPVQGVIPGWVEGLQLMNEGSTYRFYVPSDLAYGVQGARTIPPNTTLIFKVELISILDQADESSGGGK